jgi:hypothetical protein
MKPFFTAEDFKDLPKEPRGYSSFNDLVDQFLKVINAKLEREGITMFGGMTYDNTAGRVWSQDSDENRLNVTNKALLINLEPLEAPKERE